MKRTGFTLIELIVVIAILGILLSILVPVAGRMNQTASNTQCLSRLGQQAKGFLAACADQGGKLPFYRKQGDPTFRIFYDFIDEHVDIDGVVMCPEVTEPKPGGWWGGRNYPWKFVTLGNEQYGAYCFNAWLHDSDMSWWGQNNPRGFFGQYVSSITGASNVPMACDGYWVDAWPKLGDPVPPTGAESNLQGSGQWYQRIFTDRHMPDRQNFSFVDGHARTVMHTDITSLRWSREF